MFRSPYFPQSPNDDLSVFSSPASLIFSPLFFVANSFTAGGDNTTFVANQVVCRRGIATPKIIPGKPANDSGPPLTGISSA